MNRQTADEIAAGTAKKLWMSLRQRVKEESKRQKKYDIKRRTRKLGANYNSIKAHVDKRVPGC